MHRTQIDHIIGQFETGQISRKQAVWSIIEMPEIPDFKGIWEILIIHITLLEISQYFPNAERFSHHWNKEIQSWQNRLIRFIDKPKASYRNAVKKHFYRACDQMFKDDYANLLLNMEIHIEEILGCDDTGMGEKLLDLNLNLKDMSWFLQYPGKDSSI